MRIRAIPLTSGITVWWLLACAGVGEPSPAPEVPIAPGTPPVGAPAAGGAEAGTPAVADVAPEPAAAPAPAEPAAEPPIPCSDDCLLLLDYAYDELSRGQYCELCGPYVEEACELDWPSSDVMACEQYDYLRNCIYARLGYTFETAPEWRRVFDKESWYTPDPRFEWSRVSALQAANAKELKRIVSRRQCER
jgi:hypothetical protein